MATYQIDTLAKLRDITPTHLDDDCVLLNDIDASATATWNISGGVYAGFAPIGTNAAPFTGTFDGAGFTISGLYINRPTTDYVGLFGKCVMSSGTDFMKSITLTDVDISGDDYTGGLAGYIEGDGLSVDECHVTGSVTGSGAPIGGLAGEIYRGGAGSNVDITDCTATVTVTGSMGSFTVGAMGGLIGYALYCDLVDCWSAGTVSLVTEGGAAAFAVGGLVGHSSNSSCTTCHSSAAALNAYAAATYAVYLGGLLGNGGAGTCTACYASGGANNTGAGICYAGGFVGYSSAAHVQCMARGNVNNKTAISNRSGGFIGSVLGGSCTDCYASGNICSTGVNDASAYIGGFAGYGASAYTITNCYSIGAVYTPAPHGGGLVGGGTSPTTTSCYWDTETSGWSTSLVGTGKTTAQMKVIATFTSWDFDTIWQIASFTMPAIAESGLNVWFSGVDDYENFEAGLIDDDSFSLTIQTTNEVRWVESLGDLLVGTAADEWKVGSNKVDTPITPTNWTVKQQSSYGSAAIQPVKVGSVILFVDFVGRKVRELTFDGGSDRYVAPDLTSLAEHITYSGIVCMAHQKNTDSMLWCVLADGSLISMNYDRDQNVVAWAKHPIGGDGLVQSVCVTPGATEDEVFITVGRTLEGDIVYYEDEIVTYEDETVTVYIGDVTYIEKMASRVFTDIEDCFFVDSGITFTAATATKTVTGLTHLVGETVKILADGIVQDSKVVDADGEITLDTAANTVQVGLPFTSLLQPMRLIVDDSMGSITRVGELVISFLNSLGVKYGSQASDLHNINFDDERWENTASITGTFSGECVVSMPGGFSVYNPIIISTDAPLPAIVRCLVARIERMGR